MTAFRGLKLLTHALVIQGFYALYIAHVISGLVLILAVFVASYSLYSSLNRDNGLLTGKYSNFLGAALIVGVLTGFVFFEADFFSALIYLLVFIQISKLAGKKGTGDYLQIVLISFFQFLASSVSTYDIIYGFLAISFLVTALANIILYNVCRESSDFGEKEDVKIFDFSFLKIMIPASMLILVLASLIFTVMPRFRGSMITASLIHTERLKSGFSDEVSLGKVGEIKNDNSQVMTVKFPGIDGQFPDPGELYWRGVTLDEFDGRNWRSTVKERRILYENRDGVIFVKKSQGNSIVKQEIVTEQTGTDVIFAADRPVAYGNLPNRRMITRGDSHYTFGSSSSKIKYTAYSEIGRIMPYGVDSEERIHYPDHIVRNYLTGIYSSERISELADELNNPSYSKLENVRSIEAYLQDNFNYTRILQDPADIFPLEDFLFNMREGHCEYFATAMVVLLRDMGIPSRLVTGFAGGEFNEKGGFYIIREGNAHAWVEVFFNGHGWVRFDPTPPDNEAFYSSGFLDSYWAYMRYRWNRYVVDFDKVQQELLFKGVRSSLINSREKMSSKIPDGQYYFLILIIIGGVIAAGFIIKNNRISLPGTSSYNTHSEASRIYKDVLGVLEKKGLKRQDHHTSIEFVKLVKIFSPAVHELFISFTDMYIETRFSGDSGEEKLQELRKLGKLVSREIRSVSDYK